MSNSYKKPYKKIRFNLDESFRNKKKSIRIMRIKYPANYDSKSNLLFLETLITYKPKTHANLCWTLSPDVARYLSNALLEGLEKLNLEENKDDQ